MGRFSDWLHGRKREKEPVNEAEDVFASAYTGSVGYAPPLPSYTEDDDYHGIAVPEPEEYSTPDAGDALDDNEEAPGDVIGEPVPGWKRKGRPYVHFRTVKIVDRDGGFKFKIVGRSGKSRYKSDIYTAKNNAKRAAVAWVRQQGIPTRFTEDQYDGQVVLDTDPQG